MYPCWLAGVPEEFSAGWTNDWLQKGFRPVQTAQFVYQNVWGRDVVRKTKFVLFNVSDGKPSGQKTYVVQHRSALSVRLGAQRWESGVGKEEWAADLLYRRVQLDHGIEMGRTIYVCEGEKDADSVAEAWGFVATSHYQGAAGMRREQAEVIASLSPLSRVVFLIDNDVTGYQLADHNHRMLRACGFLGLIKIYRPGLLVDKADISDHIAAGLDREAAKLIGRKELAKVIEEHGTLSTRTGGRWGYGYGDQQDSSEDLGEWTVTRA